jgi:hypothetical protein
VGAGFEEVGEGPPLAIFFLKVLFYLCHGANVSEFLIEFARQLFLGDISVIWLSSAGEEGVYAVKECSSICLVLWGQLGFSL